MVDLAAGPDIVTLAIEAQTHPTALEACLPAVAALQHGFRVQIGFVVLHDQAAVLTDLAPRQREPARASIVAADDLFEFNVKYGDHSYSLQSPTDTFSHRRAKEPQARRYQLAHVPTRTTALPGTETVELTAPL
jgi:hypothetical protein